MEYPGVPVPQALQAVLPCKEAWAKHPLCCEFPREIRSPGSQGKDGNCPILRRLPSRSELVKGLKKCCCRLGMAIHSLISIPDRSLKYGMDLWIIDVGLNMCTSPGCFLDLALPKEKYKRTASSKFVEGRKPILGIDGHRCQDIRLPSGYD